MSKLLHMPEDAVTLTDDERDELRDVTGWVDLDETVERIIRSRIDALRCEHGSSLFDLCQTVERYRTTRDGKDHD